MNIVLTRLEKMCKADIQTSHLPLMSSSTIDAKINTENNEADSCLS